MTTSTVLSNKKRYTTMIISVILGTVVYIVASVLDIAFWVHIISIFLSLVIIEFMRNVCFPIDPKSKYLENVDLNGAIILFILVFGPIASIFHLITSLLYIIKKKGGSSNASS